MAVEFPSYAPAGSSGAVASVNGETGAVVLTKADIGLGNVANLAPADLPVSSATTTALASKVGSGTVQTIWTGTQAAYNAIGSKSPTTLYVVTAV